MNSSPLCTHPNADSIVAYRLGEPVTRSTFLAEAQQLANQFPAGSYILNACKDRYHFATGFAAALMTGRISLLPSTHTPDMVHQMRLLAPDVFCLIDGPSDMDLPQLRYPLEPAPACVPAVPSIADHTVAAMVFTSGSTGKPRPHPKTWGCLVQGARAQSQRLQATATGVLNLIGTVPPQHMYGFESTVLLPLQTGATLWAGRPFYPTDIVEALATAPRPRALVTSPIHLRALLSVAGALPPIDLILSATAPLDVARAREAEMRLGAPLVEIYGATETGQVASRRTTVSLIWETLPALQLREHPDGVAVSGGHLQESMLLCDRIERQDATHFVLHGRGDDIINIAGKRTSLAFLEHQLTNLPGVQDAAFWVPDEEPSAGAARLAAFVVAPGLTVEDVMAALRARVDPAFLPRPLQLVDVLPRNATGKLPREALAALLKRPAVDHDSGTVFVFNADHPAFAGHFPGHPVVPGVLLLDAVIGSLAGTQLLRGKACLEGVKFLGPVGPGERVVLTQHPLPADRIEFRLHAGERPVALGQLRFLKPGLST